MKRVLIVVVLLVGAAVLGMWRTNGGIRSNLRHVVGGVNTETQAGQTTVEIRKSFEMHPGDHLEVAGINGPVEIETADVKTAEVFVLRTGDSQEQLNRREVTLEQTPTGLLVRARRASGLGFWGHLFGHDPNEHVSIKAPRQIALSIRGVNGKVTSGDVDGTVEVKGINGRVELGQATESAEIGGINGNVRVALKQLGDRGAKLSGINGNIEIQVLEGLNADLTAKGLNGSVRSDIPEVTVDKGENHSSRYSARIGAGGPPITLSGINGNVRLTSANAAPSTATASKKVATEVKAATEKSSKGQQ